MFRKSASEASFLRIHRLVAGIPKGRVEAYGRLALLAGLPRPARLGWRAAQWPLGRGRS
jgi:alkylated DNA nucleotide flippase Atl1